MIRLQRARLWTLVWMLGFAGPALAQEASDALQPRRFQPNAYAGMKIGNERIIGQFGFLGPIVQSRNSLVFMDLRGRVDDQTSGEGNFGLGVRHVLGDRRFVGGAYGYFDILRSAQSNTFVQGTFGLEFSSEHWMARGNAYIPEDRDQVISYLGGPEGPQFVGTTIKIVRGLGKAVVERPLMGFDVEVGRRFALFGNDLWLHGAYYRFTGSGLPTVEGPRLRGEYEIDLASWLPNAKLAVGGEWQRDDLRGNQGFGTLEFRYAFGGDRSRGSSPRGGVHWTDRRMVGRITRDIDILTGNRVTGADPVFEVAFNPGTGDPFGAIVTVAKGGSPTAAGSPDDPVDIAGAPALAGNGGVIVFSDSGGGIIDTSVPLRLTPSNDKTIVAGGGGFLDVSAADGELFRLLIPGGNPTIRTTLGSLIDVNGATNVALLGLELDGGGIDFAGAGGEVLVQDVNIVNSLSTGLRIDATSDATFNINRLTVTNPLGIGVHLDGTLGDVTVDGLRVESSGGAGVSLDGTLGKVAFRDVAIDNSSSAGVGFRARDAAEIVVTGALFNLPSNSIKAGSGGAIDIESSMGSATILDQFWNQVDSMGADTGIRLSGVSGELFVDDSTIDGMGGSTSTAVSIEDSTVKIEIVTSLDIDNVTTGIDLSHLDCEVIEDVEVCGKLTLFGTSNFRGVAGSAIRMVDSAGALYTGLLPFFEDPDNLIVGVDILDTGGDAIVLSNVSGLAQITGTVAFSESTTNRAINAQMDGGTLAIQAFEVFGAGGGGMTATDENAAAVWVQGANDVTVEDFLITGVQDEDHVNSARGLLIEDTRDRVAVLGLGFSGLVGFFSLVNDIDGDGLVIRNLRGAGTDGPNVNVHSTYVQNVRGDGIVVEFIGSHPGENAATETTIGIESSRVLKAAGDGIVVRAEAESATAPAANNLWVNIRNNEVERVLGDAIVAQASPGFDIDVVASDNVLRDEFNCDFDGDGECDGSEFFLARDYLSANPDAGTGIRIEVSAAGQPSDAMGDVIAAENDVDIVVRGNTITNWRQSGILLTTAASGAAAQATALIDTNTISGSTGPGIEVATGHDLDVAATIVGNLLTETPGILATSASPTGSSVLGVDAVSNDLAGTGTTPTYAFDSSGITLNLRCDPAQSCPSSPLTDASDFVALFLLNANTVESMDVGMDDFSLIGGSFPIVDDIRRVVEQADETDPDEGTDP